MGILYMSNNAEFEDMITYSDIPSHRKYFTGSEIKDVITRCLNDQDTTKTRKQELITFEAQYIKSKYPLSNNKLYSLSWCGEDMDILKCYKKQDN